MFFANVNYSVGGIVWYRKEGARKNTVKKGVFMNKIPKTVDLFDISHSIAEDMLGKCEYPFAAILKIGDFIEDIAARLDRSYREIEKGVFVGEGTKIGKSVTLIPPLIIGRNADIRSSALLRGRVIVGDGAVIGNSSEVKNSIILDEGKLPHYNYAGDSIIGYRAHLGAGALCSNLRLDKRNVLIGNERLDTGQKKLGAMIGDYAEVGCGAVLSPGAIIGREAIIYPLTHVRGVLPERCIFDGEAIRDRI